MKSIVLKRTCVQILLLLSLASCRKPVAENQPSANTPYDYRAKLLDHTWGFFKSGEPNPERSIEFSSMPLKFHDGPENYFLKNDEITCEKRFCQISDDKKKIFAIQFLNEDVIEVVQPWEMPESVEGMHRYGGVIIEKGERYKPILDKIVP
jgi:hypothetical protein